MLCNDCALLLTWILDNETDTDTVCSDGSDLLILCYDGALLRSWMLDTETDTDMDAPDLDWDVVLSAV